MKSTLPFLMAILLASPLMAVGKDAQSPTVEDTVKARWPMIQRCYKNQLRKGAVGDGKIVVGFQTSERGYVDTAWIHESTIDNDIVKRCVIYRFKKLKFKLKGGKTLKGLYPLVFSAESVTPKSYAKPVSNEVAKNLIDSAIEEKWPKFRKCYLREQIRSAKLKPGEVHVNFVVNERGKVSSATLHQSSLENEYIESCIVDLFRTIRVERPLHRIVQGVYPVTFK